MKKYFTPQEANKRLPLVKQIVADILSKARDLKAIMANGVSDSKQAVYQKTLDQMESLIDELEGLGCYYKDWNFEMGLVDFPALIDGKETLLCWRSDEPDVRWYHGFDDGFAGRQPIPEDLLNDSSKKAHQDTIKNK